MPKLVNPKKTAAYVKGLRNKDTKEKEKKKTPPSADAGTPAGVAAKLKWKLIDLPIETLYPGPNARTFTPEEEQYCRNELLPTVQRHGVRMPLWVREKPAKKGQTHEIIAGERRWRTARMANLAALRCDVCLECSDAMAAELGLIENLQRRDLNSADRALGIADMCKRFDYVPWDEKRPERSAGHRLGFNKTKTHALIKIASNLPKLGLDALRSGQLSESVAARVARIPAQRTRMEAVTRAINERWTDDIAAQQIEACYMTELKGAPFDRRDETLSARGSCDKCPYRSGNMPELFDDGKKKGRGDVCTDPECFANKCNVAFAKRVEEHRKKGGEALNATQAMRAGLGSSYSHVQGDYVDLDEPARFIGRCETWRKLLKPSLDSGDFLPILAQANDGTRKVHELALRNRAICELKNLGVLKEAKTNSVTLAQAKAATVAAMSPEERKKHEESEAQAAAAEAAEEEEAEILDAINEAQIVQICDAIADRKMELLTALRLAVVGAMDGDYYYPSDDEHLAVAKRVGFGSLSDRLGGEKVVQDPREWLAAYIMKAGSLHEICALLTETVLRCNSGPRANPERSQISAFAEAAGIDMKALEEAIRAQRAQPKQETLI